MPLRAGMCFRNSSRASRPPAEAPMPMIGNAFCTPEGSDSGLAGTVGLFFRVFGPERFFTVGILDRVEGGEMRLA
jgi:hypothetical protein